MPPAFASIIRRSGAVAPGQKTNLRHQTCAQGRRNSLSCRLEACFAGRDEHDMFKTRRQTLLDVFAIMFHTGCHRNCGRDGAVIPFERNIHAPQPVQNGLFDRDPVAFGLRPTLDELLQILVPLPPARSGREVMLLAIPPHVFLWDLFFFKALWQVSPWLGLRSGIRSNNTSARPKREP